MTEGLKAMVALGVALGSILHQTEFARRKVFSAYLGGEREDRALCEAGKTLDRAPAKFRDSGAQGNVGKC